MGQRIRYLTEGHDTSAVSVARSCRATKWWCDALLGLALHVAGGFAASDSAFARALNGMATPMRCHWHNLATLLDDDIRDTYCKLTFAQRELMDVRIWGRADELFTVPDTQRSTEQIVREYH